MQVALELKLEDDEAARPGAAGVFFGLLLELLLWRRTVHCAPACPEATVTLLGQFLFFVGQRAAGFSPREEQEHLRFSPPSSATRTCYESGAIIIAK